MMKVLLTVVAGLVSVTAQYNTYNNCKKNGFDYQSGTKIGHEKFCNLYEICEGGKWEVRACPRGQLFNSDYSQIDCLTPDTQHLAIATSFCLQWPVCNNGGNYPDICCSRYWACTNRLFKQETCPHNQVFDYPTGRCVQNNGQCKDHRLCNTGGGVNPTTRPEPTPDPNPEPNPEPNPNHQWVCNLIEVVGDVCKFKMAGYAGNMSCAAGTEFNKTLCGCQHSQRCDNPLPGTSNMMGNKTPDSLCSASYATAFEFGDRVARSVKLNINFGPVIKTNAQFVNLEAIMVPNTGSELYIYYYAENQLIAPFTMLTIFKIDDQVPFDLVTNGSPGDNDQRCPPTFRISVTPQYGQVTFNIMAKSGDIPNATENISLQSSVSTNNYMALFVWLDTSSQVLKAKLYDIGTTPGSHDEGSYAVGDAVGTTTIGRQLKVSPCGFSIGHKMSGKIYQWNMYEGCTTPETTFFGRK